MVVCNKRNVSTKKTQVCIGRLNKRINFNKRVQRFTSSGMTLEFETVFTLWANAETRNGLDQFNHINIGDEWTHLWKVRLNRDLTSEYWVNYKDNNYDIVRIEHKDEYKYTYVYTRLTGDDTLEGSKS